jgi:hypothetical protein
MFILGSCSGELNFRQLASKWLRPSTMLPGIALTATTPPRRRLQHRHLASHQEVILEHSLPHANADELH